MPILVRDLTPTDLPACTWSGSTAHLMQVERELVRAAAGDVDYLAVCTPADVPVAIGGIDYQVTAGVGTLWQLGVLPALQWCGLGTMLIRAAEDRIRSRGLHGPSSRWRRAIHGPGPCTSDWATWPTVADRTPGTSRRRTAHCSGTRPCAR